MVGLEVLFFVEIILVVMGAALFIAYIASVMRKTELLEIRVHRLERRLGRRYK